MSLIHIMDTVYNYSLDSGANPGFTKYWVQIRCGTRRRRRRDQDAKSVDGEGGMERGYPLPSRLGVLGEHRKLPQAQRGSERSPGRKRILVHALWAWKYSCGAKRLFFTFRVAMVKLLFRIIGSTLGLEVTAGVRVRVIDRVRDKLPPYLQLAASEMWCWSGGKGI